MTTYLAFLRAINVAGQRALPMAPLRVAMIDHGFEGVASVLQSGNLVFQSNGPGGTELERSLEKLVEGKFGVQTDIFVRTAPEWAAVIQSNPYPDQAARDPAHLVAMILRSKPPPKALGELRAAIRGRETVELDGRQAYLVYPDGMGTSKLTIAVIERKLGTRGTARNWNTVRKLATLAGV